MLLKKILICDDHSLFGNGVRELLRNKHYQVTLVSTSNSCLELLNKEQFDVFLCDLNIDSKNGFELYNEAKANLSKTMIFLLTAYTESFLITKAEKLGFNGFLSKETSYEELIYALEMKKSDSFFSSKNITLNKNSIEGTKEFSTQSIKLSKQEKEIIKWIVKGKTSKEIGEILFITKATVDTHRRNINRKLELKTIGSLIQFAHENSIID
jgi:DNA-binding NarL/FixJ family response regulator